MLGRLYRNMTAWGEFALLSGTAIVDRTNVRMSDTTRVQKRIALGSGTISRDFAAGGLGRSQILQELGFSLFNPRGKSMIPRNLIQRMGPFVSAQLIKTRGCRMVRTRVANK